MLHVGRALPAGGVRVAHCFDRGSNLDCLKIEWVLFVGGMGTAFAVGRGFNLQGFQLGWVPRAGWTGCAIVSATRVELNTSSNRVGVVCWCEG